MKKPAEEGKLVIIKSYGPIYELGGISGPVSSPSFIPMSKLVQMLNSHKVIFEVNPSNPKETVKLTFSNLRSENFKVAKKEPVKIINQGKKEEPKVEEEQPKKEEKKEEVKKSDGDFVKQK